MRVFNPDGQRQLERTVSPPAEEALASSTTAELAAVIVRSALQAIGSGRSIGERVEAPARATSDTVATLGPYPRARPEKRCAR